MRVVEAQMSMLDATLFDKLDQIVSFSMDTYLIKLTYGLVIESQLPLKIVDLLLTTTN